MQCPQILCAEERDFSLSASQWLCKVFTGETRAQKSSLSKNKLFPGESALSNNRWLVERTNYMEPLSKKQEKHGRDMVKSMQNHDINTDFLKILK